LKVENSMGSWLFISRTLNMNLMKMLSDGHNDNIYDKNSIENLITNLSKEIIKNLKDFDKI